MQIIFQKDIRASLSVLKNGGLILYPTDTIWGIGCNALNSSAVEKIYKLKKRPDEKAMIILVSDEEQLGKFIRNIPSAISEYLKKATKPTTVIYKDPAGLPANLISKEGTIAIRIVQDEFCKKLIESLGSPIVSTSANISGEPSPQNFSQINPEIKNGVDFIVQHRQNDFTTAAPSSIIKFKDEGIIEIIRS